MESAVRLPIPLDIRTSLGYTFRPFLREVIGRIVTTGMT